MRLVAELRSRVDACLDANGLLLLVLGYLVMPYPVKGGWPSFCAIIPTLLGFWALITYRRVKTDLVVIVLLLLLVGYDLLFIFKEGFGFTLFRAYCFGLLTYICIVLYANRRGLERLFKALVIWVVLTAALSVAQFIGGEFFYVPLWLGWCGGLTDWSLFNFCRLTTSVGLNIAKTQVAGQLVFFIPLFASLAPGSRIVARTWLPVFLLSLLVMVLGLSFSRSAFLGVFVPMFLALLFGLRKYWKVVTVFVLVLGATLFAMRLDTRPHECRHPGETKTASYTSNDLFKRHFFFGTDRTTFKRVKLIMVGLEMFAERPLGGGSGYYLKNYTRYAARLSGDLDPKGTPSTIGTHNSYLQVVVDKGILGFIFLFCVLVWVIVRTCIHAFQDSDDLSWGVLLGLLGLLVYSLAHVTMGDRMFWIGLGLAVSCYTGMFSAKPESEAV